MGDAARGLTPGGAGRAYQIHGPGVGHYQDGCGPHHRAGGHAVADTLMNVPDSVGPRIEYRDAQRLVRPPRVAVLLADGEAWEHGAMRMIENFCRTWGGGAGALFTAKDDGRIATPFWSLLAAYDPDEVGVYVHTLRGWQMADPAAFEAWLQQQTAQLAADHGSTPERERHRLLEGGSFLTEPISGWQVPDPIQEEMRRRLAPFGSKQLIVRALYKADAPPVHNLTDICKLTWVPDRIRLLDTHHWPPRVRLLISARVGVLAASHISDSMARGSTVETVITRQEDLPGLLELAWSGQIDRSLFYLRRALAHAGGDPPPVEGPYWDQDFLSDTPMTQSEYGCAWQNRWRPSLDEDPVVLLVGDSGADFGWAYTRQRCVGPTLWCPLTESEDPIIGPILVTVLARVLERLSNRHGERVPVLVASMSAEHMIDNFVDRLRADPSTEIDLQPCLIEDIPLPPTKVLLDVERVDSLRELFLDGLLAGQVDVPLPTKARSIDPWACRWIIDFLVNGHHLPARWAVGPLADAAGEQTRSVRSGADGVCYQSHGHGFVVGGSTLQQMLVQLRPRLPSAAEVFAALLGPDFSLQTSSAGRYTQRCLELWGGLDPLVEALKTPAVSQLLHAWLSKQKSGVDPGVFCSDRRFLSFEDASAASDLAEEDLRQILDRYIERAILRRGLVLGCDRCSNADFYRLEDVGRTFQCSRCRLTNPIVQSAWKAPTEPSWYYSLDEVVYQMLRGDGRVPILALAKLKEGSRSFLFVPEMHLGGADLDIELDLWALVDGEIVIGEAKKSAYLEKAAKTEKQRCVALASVAQAVTADRFVLATAADQWIPRTLSTMSAQLEHRTGLTVLTGI